ncbi:hypothetical protein BMS3Abin03_00859 [bacterium BMS3Abin03]|nr:hypothetical protein BMS3Abin03_00859 [bacterium BMS3Abin03]
MRNAFYTFLTFFCMISIFTVATFSQSQQDEQKIWSKIFVDQGTINPGNTNYKWDRPQPQTRQYLFGGNGIAVFPNFRPHPTTTTTQSELSVDVAPFDENIIFCSANTTPWPVSTVYGTGVYWSLDGSQSWTGFDIPPFGGNSGDPASAIGTNGFFYENYINNPGGQGISISTNNGVDWINHTVAPNPGSLADKNHMNVDKTLGSPYENRIYVVWTDFGGANDNDVVLRYSTNDGSTWSSSINLSSSLSAGSHNQGVNVQTGPNGEVYATWAIYDNWPSGEDAIGFAKSTDGGATWTSARIYGALTPNGNFNFGIRGYLKPTQIRVASFPSMAVDRSGGTNDGNIYISWAQRNVTPAGNDPDIVMIKSTDGGATWSSPVRVNDDAMNNGKDQYFNWMTVDQSTGQVLLVFYDGRNVSNDSSSVWMASSLDGGSTFNNFEVSEQPFKPKPIPGLAGGYQGDYIGIAALNDVAYPYWMDDRTNIYQAWMSTVSFGPPCPIDPPTNPSPANGATDVSSNLSEISWTNGAGASQIEVWYGIAGSMTMVYDGSPVTSYSIPSQLAYSTTYNWRVIGKNDTCNVSGPTWAFTTELSPGVLFLEPFPDLNNWTIIGPEGLPNWSVTQTSFAAGTAPELNFHWSPSFTGDSYILSIPIAVANDHNMELQFDHFVDWYADPLGPIGCAITYDGGSTYSTLWEISPNGNVGPENIVLNFATPPVAAMGGNASTVNLQIAFYYTGNSFNIDDWYIDNVMLTDLDIVPVELTSFAAVLNKGDVQLGWATATEVNNQGFEVERKSVNGEFQKIGYVPGHGTTTENQSYSFIDSKIPSGTYVYRLKQLDYDGSYEYSSEINVDVAAPLTFSLDQNYPNPFNPSTVIKYSIPNDGFVLLDIYNLLGEKVASLVNSVQKAGRYEITFDASNLASGIYVYSLKSGSFSSVKKMLLMK